MNFTEQYTKKINQKKNIYSSNKIWEAYQSLNDSGIFPYFSVTNPPEVVKFVIDNYKKIIFNNISLASSLFEEIRAIDQVSLFGSYRLRLRSILSILKDLFNMRNLSLESNDDNNTEIIVIIEYFSRSTSDLDFFNSIEKTNPSYNIEYWITNPSLKKKIKAIASKDNNQIYKKLLKNNYTIMELCKRNMIYFPELNNILHKNKIFQRLGKLFSKIWLYLSVSKANNIANGLFYLFKIKNPKLILLTDDTKLYGSLAAKVARLLKIPSILIPHAIPTPFYFPLIADYQTAWSDKWKDYLEKHQLESNRILVTGDLTKKPKTLSNKEKNKLKKKIGIDSKYIVGYFASPSETNNSGLFALVNALHKFEKVMIIVRSHPRHHKFSTKLKESLINSNAIYLDYENFSFEEFSSISNIVATFESTALLYAMQFNNNAFQINIENKNKPENNFKELLGLEIAYNENQIEKIIETNYRKYKKTKIKTHVNTDFCIANGEESAIKLFNRIKNIIN